MDAKLIVENNATTDMESSLRSSCASTSAEKESISPVSDRMSNEIEKVAESATGTVGVQAELDPNVVDWDGTDDPDMPLNWTSRKKWTNILFVAALALLTYVFLALQAYEFF